MIKVSKSFLISMTLLMAAVGFACIDRSVENSFIHESVENYDLAVIAPGHTPIENKQPEIVIPIYEVVDNDLLVFHPVDDLILDELDLDLDEVILEVVEDEDLEDESVEDESVEDEDLGEEIVEDEDLPIILSDSESQSYLALVNHNFKLAADFTPDDLTRIGVESLNGTHFLRLTAARAAEDLFSAAYDEEEFTLLAGSGYRSYDVQEAVHHNWINVLGVEEASRISARPGHSEHQLGLALDISTHALGGYLTEEFSTTPEGEWVRENAHRFGFIVRYPQEREDDTGFAYEPWHIRYVGIDVATEIFYNEQILEEYLEYLSY